MPTGRHLQKKALSSTTPDADSSITRPFAPQHQSNEEEAPKIQRVAAQRRRNIQVTERTAIQPKFEVGGVSQRVERSPEPLFQAETNVIQPKLTIGAPGDKYEQEADRVAADVMRKINAPPISAPPRNDGKMVQTQMQGSEVHHHIRRQVTATSVPNLQADFETQLNRARGGGSPLDNAFRAKVEPLMGADFSRVRVHTDAQADALSRSIQAKAFTTGQDVFFRQGAYEPGSRGGQELIAHELTHVVQQTELGILQRVAYSSETEEAVLFNKVPQQLSPPTAKQQELLKLNEFKQKEANRLNKTVAALTAAEVKTAISNALDAFKERFAEQGKITTAENQGGLYAGADELEKDRNITKIPMTFHHIIPRNLLRDFWNLIINNGDMSVFAAAVKGIINETYKRTPFDQSALEIDGEKQTKEQLANIVDKISRGHALIKNTQKDEQAPEGIIATLYQWMPGNIFHGPSNRVKPDNSHFTYIPEQDDGGDDFDRGAQHILPKKEYENLYETYRLINEYGEMGKGQAIKPAEKSRRKAKLENIGQRIGEISKKTSVWSFEPKQWRIIEDPTSGEKSKNTAYWRVRPRKV